MSGEHPSYYALDGLLLGRPVSEAVHDHVAGCERCSAYLHGRKDEQAAVPSWVAALRAHSLPGGSGGSPAVAAPARARVRRRVMASGLAFVAAAGIWLAAGSGWRQRVGAPGLDQGPGDQFPGITAKGAPAITVFVKRGEQVFAWDGRAEIRPRDSLRLRVHGEGHGFVSVAALSGEGDGAAPGSDGADPEVLYAGPVERDGAVLPVSFRVDERGRQEVLSVILGRRPISARAHREVRDGMEEAATWRQILILNKTTGAGGPGRSDIR